MKNKIVYFTLLMFISLFLVGCTSSKVGNYKKEDYGLLSIYDLYVLQSSNEFDSKECANCLKVDESFCEKNETITIKGLNVNLSDALDDKLLEEDQVQCLMDHDVVKHYRIPYILYKIGEIVFGIFKGL